MRGFFINPGLDDAIAQTGQYATGGNQPFDRGDQDQSKPDRHGKVTEEKCGVFQFRHNGLQHQSRQHDGKEKQGNHGSGVAAGEMVFFHQKRQVIDDDKVQVCPQTVQDHGFDQIADHETGFCLDGRFGVPVCRNEHAGASGILVIFHASRQKDRQDKRNGGQKVNDKRPPPVHFGQIAGDDGGDDEGQVGDGRTVAELFQAFVPDEEVGNQTGRERHDQAGTDPQYGGNDDQLPHLVGKKIQDTREQEYTEPDAEQDHVVDFFSQPPGDEDKRDDHQGRQGSQHLDIQFAGAGKNIGQLPQNRRYGQPGQGVQGRNGPDPDQGNK